MKRRRGGLTVTLTTYEGVGSLKLVHTGLKGNRTLSRFSHSLVDRVAFKEAVATWLVASHPKLRLAEEASR